MARVPEYQQMIGEPAVPDVRTRVQASPADFGAARDQALEGLGATVEQFGQEMARLDEHLSQVAAQKAFEKTRAQSMAIMTEFGNLEGDNAVSQNREIMGATNPKDAAAGTIRADFADSIGENAVHGSDSLENAAVEISYFFSTSELCARTR